MTDPAPKTQGSRKWLSGLITVVIGFGIVGYVVAASGPKTSRDSWPVRFASPGEQLYFTGRGASSARMMPRGGNHHMTMMGSGGCVDCHGTDRRGGRLFPSIWQVAPPITAVALAGDHGDHGHSHDSYTAETLALAITDGIRPDGSALGAGMPRWSMPGPDLDALVGYLLER